MPDDASPTALRTDVLGARDGTALGEGWVRSACVICLNRCGILAHVTDDDTVDKILGDPDNPHNHGKTCAKGDSGMEGLRDPDRITTPLRRTNPDKGLGVDPAWAPISWDDGAVGDRGAPEVHPGRGPQRAPVLHLRRLPVAGPVHRCLDQRVRPSRLHDVVGADLLRQQRARHQLHEPERLRGRPGPGVLEVHHAVRLAVRLGRALRHDARRPRAVTASPRRPEDRLDRPGAGSRRLQGRGVGADPARHRRRLDPGHGQPTGQRAAHLRRVVRQAAHERAVPRGAGRSLCPRDRHRQAAGVGRQRRHGQALRR